MAHVWRSHLLLTGGTYAMWKSHYLQRTHKAMAPVWMSEGNLQKLDLSFQHVSSRDQMQIIKTGCKYLYRVAT